MKRLLSLCIPALILGLAWNYIFNYHISRSLMFWMRCAETSDKWETTVRRNNLPCYVFVGASETRTAIDPEQLLQDHGILSINAAEQANFSAICNYEAATKYLKKGDTLVISYPIANIDLPPSRSGLQFLWKRTGIRMFSDGLIKPNYSNICSLFLGDGGYFSITLVKAIFTSGPTYSYEIVSRIHPSGWMEVFRNRPLRLVRGIPTDKAIPGISPKTLAHYAHLQELCARRGVHLLFRTHLEYRNESYRAVHALRILNLVRAGFKVIKEERLGCEPDVQHFSDTINHLSSYGTKKYMEELGTALKNQEVWTEEELIEKLREYGRDSEGKPL